MLRFLSCDMQVHVLYIGKFLRDKFFADGYILNDMPTSEFGTLLVHSVEFQWLIHLLVSVQNII